MYFRFVHGDFTTTLNSGPIDTHWVFKNISKIGLFCLKTQVTAVSKKENISILELFGTSFKNPGGRYIEFLKGFQNGVKLRITSKLSMGQVRRENPDGPSRPL